MGIVPDFTHKPIGFKKSYTLGSGAANQTELTVWVAGCTDLTIFIENEDAAQGITVSIDWAMAEKGHGASGSEAYIDAITGDPTIAANAVDHWRFASRWPTVTTDHILDPYYIDVLPCSFIKISMYGTTAASACRVWLQGHKQRL